MAETKIKSLAPWFPMPMVRCINIEDATERALQEICETPKLLEVE